MADLSELQKKQGEIGRELDCLIVGAQYAGVYTPEADTLYIRGVMVKKSSLPPEKLEKIQRLEKEFLDVSKKIVDYRIASLKNPTTDEREALLRRKTYDVHFTEKRPTGDVKDIIVLNADTEEELRKEFKKRYPTWELNKIELHGGNPSVEVRGFTCRSSLEDMYACSLNEIDKEIEKLKRYIAEGRKGTALEPRDYRRELDAELHRKESLIKVHSYLKDKCPE